MKRSLVMPMKPFESELEFETNSDMGEEKGRWMDRAKQH